MIKHQHLIIRSEVEKPITDVEFAQKWFKDLVEKINMKILSGPYVEYSNQKGNEGLTGVVVIETSHCALHIWDREKPALAQLDIYTCSDLPIDIVFEHLKIMKPIKTHYKFIDREKGLIDIMEGNH